MLEPELFTTFLKNEIGLSEDGINITYIIMTDKQDMMWIECAYT